jgi:signal transduction histidine kinase
MSDGLLVLLPPLAGWLISSATGLGPSSWLMLALTCGQSFALLFMRRFPFAVFVVVTGLEISLAVMKMPVMAGFLVAAAALGSWGRGVRQRVGVAGGLSVLFAGVAYTSISSGQTAAVLLFFGVVAVLFLGSWGIGRARRRQRARIADLQVRSHRLEAERELAEQRAAERERALLARELHDILNHSVTAMVMDAESAADSGEITEASLRRVASTGRESLAELRRLLRVLRADPSPHDPLAPPPRLKDLADLVESLPPGGPVVTLEQRGEEGPVDTSIELAAYRVVQESLTNVVKHAGSVEVAVVLSYLPTRLEIQVTNPIPASPTREALQNGSGVGLVGMRERVELLGGTLRLDRGPKQFSVHATLPLRSPA